MPAPDRRLHLAPLPASPRGVVLMLHGGAEHGLEPIDHRSLSYRRTRWMLDSIAGRLAREGVGVALLRFTVRGWNAGHADVPPPVADARGALDQLRRERPGLPVVLLGHSMGGRTAVHVADDPNVRGVVALAPWLPPGESVEALRGKTLYAAHGSRDRITSARGTAAYVRRAAEVAETAEFTDMGRVGHYLLRGRRSWNAFALESALRVLGTD